ncbi:MAG TPA: riboflavin synthase [Thermodesulfovibrionales bacterium]|nr:riboflavin synthase [Thermodesulfovibrionales bacterium]
MFTGIILELGSIVSLNRRGGGASLTVASGSLSTNAAVGDSIAINGCCLTVVRIDGDMLTFDLSDETLNSTNLGQLRAGDRVNLEPSLRADGKLGGHFVTGHVDAVGKIRTKTMVGDAFKIVIDAPEQVTGILVEKGSVSVDGISLTVVEVSVETFSIVIIPHTAKVTTIGFKNAGDSVNLEADIIGKYVARLLNIRRPASGSDDRLLKSLKNAGFM